MNATSDVREMIGRLFEARGTDLLRYIRMRVKFESDARDIAQETYLRFIRLAKPDVIENPEAYLFRMASNLVWEHQLRQQKGATTVETDREPDADEFTPMDFAISDQIGERIKDALEGLPPVPRNVMILHLRDGVTCPEIASQMGVSVSMVKKHLSRAVAHCRNHLREKTK